MRWLQYDLRRLLSVSYTHLDVYKRQEKNFINCYYAQDLTASDNGGSYAKKQTLAQMKTDQFKTDLGKNWTRKDSENQGLPYLLSVTPPKQTDIEEITVQLLVATYDTESYGFQKATDVIDVTVESSGNTRVIDVMDAAQDQGKITYTYTCLLYTSRCV